MELDYILAKQGLVIMIEKILLNQGAYKIPQTKDEALSNVIVSDKAKDSLERLRDALDVINKLHDLTITYGKELQSVKGDLYKQVVENSKLKIKNNKLEIQNQELINHVKL